MPSRWWRFTRIIIHASGGTGNWEMQPADKVFWASGNRAGETLEPSMQSRVPLKRLTSTSNKCIKTEADVQIGMGKYSKYHSQYGKQTYCPFLAGHTDMEWTWLGTRDGDECNALNQQPIDTLRMVTLLDWKITTPIKKYFRISCGNLAC